MTEEALFSTCIMPCKLKLAGRFYVCTAGAPAVCFSVLAPSVIIASRRGRGSHLFLVQNSSKFSLLSGRAPGIIYLYLCTYLQVLSSRADMPIHETRTAVLRFFTERGLTSMRNRATLAQHSTAQHSTAQHSTAQHRLTALFLRPAAARRMELNTAFVMDNRRT